MKKSVLAYSSVLCALVSIVPFARAEEPVPPPQPPVIDVATQIAPGPTGLNASEPAEPPANPSSVTKLTGGGSAGYALQSKSGSGAALGASMASTTTKSDGSTKGFTVSGGGVVGATEGPTQVPNAKLEVKGFWGVTDPFRTGTTTNNFVVKGTYERNVPMDRSHSVTAAAGLEGDYTTKKQYGSGNYSYALLGELGVGQGEKWTLPFLGVRGYAKAEECLRAGVTGRHEFCAFLDATAQAALLQVGVGAGAGAQYRWKAVEDSSGKGGVILFAGPKVSSDLRVDLEGVHTASQLFLNIGALAL